MSQQIPSGWPSPDGKVQAKAEKAYRKAMRPWYRKKRFMAPIPLLLVVLAAAAAGSGSSSSTNHSVVVASDPLVTPSPMDTPSPVVTVAPPVATKAAPPPAPTKPNDKGWVLQSFITRDDGVGDFGGVARITNTHDAATSATFTITLSRSGTVLATLQGVVNQVAAGKTVSVDLISEDKYTPGAYTSDFQTDISY